MSIYEFLIYTFGLFGLAAFSLLPYRSFSLIRATLTSPGLQRRSLWLCLAIVLSTPALLIESYVLLRIFRCLTTTYCGPGVGSGWIYLAALGFVYGTFEAVSRIIRPRI